MIKSRLLGLTDVSKADSYINRIREKRISLFRKFISDMGRPVTILDIGGTVDFWRLAHFGNLYCHNGGVVYCCEITVLNIFEQKSEFMNIRCVVVDGTDLSRYEDNSFDVVFSNSVIEHVKDREKMASEMLRVGKSVFLQTPSNLCLIEPHFMMPLFQFYPDFLKALLIQRFALGRREKVKCYEDALEEAKSVKLLSRKELINLFNGCSVYTEKMFWIPLSYIVYKGGKNEL